MRFGVSASKTCVSIFPAQLNRFQDLTARETLLLPFRIQKGRGSKLSNINREWEFSRVGIAHLIRWRNEVLVTQPADTEQSLLSTSNVCFVRSVREQQLWLTKCDGTQNLVTDPASDNTNTYP